MGSLALRVARLFLLMVSRHSVVASPSASSVSKAKNEQQLYCADRSRGDGGNDAAEVDP
jgi:hypothetical protein